jgi:hypothetical protein
MDFDNKMDGFGWPLGCWNLFGSPRWQKNKPNRSPKRKKIDNSGWELWSLAPNYYNNLSIVLILALNMMCSKIGFCIGTHQRN